MSVFSKINGLTESDFYSFVENSVEDVRNWQAISLWAQCEFDFPCEIIEWEEILLLEESNLDPI